MILAEAWAAAAWRLGFPLSGLFANGSKNVVKCSRINRLPIPGLALVAIRSDG